MHRPTLDSSGSAAPTRIAIVASIALLAACAGADTASRDTAARDTLATAGDTASAAGQGCVADGAVVTGERAGGVRLGMTADELRAACAARDTTFTLGEGLMERGLATTVAGAPVVALLGAGDSVIRVMVTGPGLATERGIAVGADLGALRAAHPAPCTLVGEGRIVVASAELQGVSFSTTADYATFATDRSAALPDTARVTEILVHGARVCEGRGG